MSWPFRICLFFNFLSVTIVKKKVLLLIGLLISFSVYAATPVGNLIIAKGKIKLRRNNADLIMDKINTKIEVFNLDEIQTGDKTSVLIDLANKSDQIELFSQSFFKIENVSAEETITSMSIGKAKIKVKKSLKKRKNKKKFSVKTTNAIIGVKGTEFVLSTGVDVTNLLTVEGIVSMANILTPDVEVNITENQVSQVKQNLSPTAPVTVPPEVQNNILTIDSPEAFNQVQFGAVIEKMDQQSEKNQKSEEEESEKEQNTEDENNNQDPNEKSEESLNQPLQNPGSAEPGDPDSTPILEPLPPPLETLPELTLEPLPPEVPEIIEFERPEIDDYKQDDTRKNVNIKITY